MDSGTKMMGLSSKKAALAARADIIREIRRFFYEEGYLEVETPLRIPAPAPESNIDAVPSRDWFLQTSPELAMKRLLAAGYEKICQICRCWRQGERGRLHLPEFTMIEWYRVDADYRGLMDDCEALIGFVARAMGYGNGVRYNSHQIDLGGRWERITVADAFRRYTSLSMEEALEKGLFDELMVTEIEPRLGLTAPVFIHDYPAPLGALAKLKADNPAVAERFELFMGGVELANAFTELTDTAEQRSRFIREQDHRLSQGKRIYPMPERFLEELPGIPSAAGIALGLDRLVMVLLDASSIDEVVAFTPEEL
jgi:elongation factor P--(R)-beta-lysine ligase